MFFIPFYPNSPLPFPFPTGKHSNVFVIIHLVNTYCMYAYYVLVQRDRNTSVTKPELKKKKINCLLGTYLPVRDAQ